jgi:dTDP-4-dehydrorhamnose 3,5-epimerase
MINGVEFKSGKKFIDERGFFQELVRHDEPFCREAIGQISHSLVYTGVIKAWHGHVRQTQWNYVVNGLVKVALYDSRTDSPTYGEIMEFLAGDHQEQSVYKFPPGVLHGYRCVNGPMNIIYMTSGTYTLEEEVRVAYDDKNIKYDWLRQNIK